LRKTVLQGWFSLLLLSTYSKLFGSLVAGI